MEHDQADKGHHPHRVGKQGREESQRFVSFDLVVIVNDIQFMQQVRGALARELSGNCEHGGQDEKNQPQLLIVHIQPPLTNEQNEESAGNEEERQVVEEQMNLSGIHIHDTYWVGGRVNLANNTL